ncbi:MAG: sulfatase-like hydrolase/transferase, partial [Halobacteriales archaeon]
MPADRPNVLLIHTDQQRWDALGANGNDEIHTPNLDRLAAEGVNFDRY